MSATSNTVIEKVKSSLLKNGPLISISEGKTNVKSTQNILPPKKGSLKLITGTDVRHGSSGFINKSSLLNKNLLESRSVVKTNQIISPPRNDSIKSNDGLNIPHFPSEFEINLSRSNDTFKADVVRRSRRKRKNNYERFSDYETSLSDFDNHEKVNNKDSFWRTYRKRNKNDVSNKKESIDSNTKESIDSNTKESIDSTGDGQIYDTSSHYNRYRTLRDRNNEASRKSRLNRKIREIEVQKEAIQLEGKNIKLLMEVNRFESIIENFNVLLLKMMRKEHTPLKTFDGKSNLSLNLVSTSQNKVKLNCYNGSEPCSSSCKQLVELERVLRNERCLANTCNSVVTDDLSLDRRNSMLVFVKNSENNSRSERLGFEVSESNNDLPQMTIKMEPDFECYVSNEVSKETQVADIIKAMKSKEMFGIAGHVKSVKDSNPKETPQGLNSSFIENGGVRDGHLQEILCGQEDSDDDDDDDDNEGEDAESNSCDIDSDETNGEYCDNSDSCEHSKTEGKDYESEKIHHVPDGNFKSGTNDSSKMIYDPSQIVEAINDEACNSNNLYVVKNKFCSDNSYGNQNKTNVSKNSDSFLYKMKNLKGKQCNIESFKIFNPKTNESAKEVVHFSNRNQSSFVSKSISDNNINETVANNFHKQNRNNSVVKMVSILRSKKSETQKILISSDNESSLIIASDLDDNNSDGSSRDDVTDRKYSNTDDLTVKEKILLQERENLLMKPKEIEGCFIFETYKNSIDLDESQHTNCETSDSMDFTDCYSAKFDSMRRRNNIASRKFRYRRRLMALDFEMQYVYLEKKNSVLKKSVEDLQKRVDIYHAALLRTAEN